MAFRRGAYVDSKTATGHTSRVGKWSAFVTLAVLILGLALAVWQVDRLKELLGSGDVRVQSTSESLIENADETCTWVIEFELKNTSGLRLRFDSVNSSMEGLLPVGGRFSPSESGFSQAIVDPSGETTAIATFQLDACPTSTEELSAARVSVNYSSTRGVRRIQVGA